KVKIFEDRDFSQYDWETANHALKRFKDAVTQIDDEQENKKILICSHGTVITLYFAYLQDKLNDLMRRWKDLKFGAVGIIKNKKVITDVI
ncbi:MAG: histidine phosphatase family protein, partial [Nanoarchaeota archaeon]|nr:histidine phosphatase family protein [Nanoarchaeota archaeon]